MSDLEVIIIKVDSIQNCMQRIVDKTQDKSNWIENVDSKDIVVLHLIRAIQLCVDIAGSIITEKKWGIPKTLSESFAILNKNNVIDYSLMKKMQKMVGFRNIATHAYKEINYDIVTSIVQNHLIDFEEFYTTALKFSEKLEK